MHNHKLLGAVMIFTFITGCSNDCEKENEITADDVVKAFEKKCFRN